MRTTKSRLLVIFSFCTLFVLSCKYDSQPQSAPNDKHESIQSGGHSELNENKNVKSDSNPIEEIEEIELLEDDKEESIKPIEKTIQEKSEQKKDKSPKSKKKKRLKPKGEITFETEQIEFGEIMQGDTVDFKFKFKNTGKGPLEIESAIPSCGCTVPSFPFLALQPGDDGFIGVKYISIGKKGAQMPTIEVNTKGSKKPVILTMKGYVKEPKNIDKAEISDSVQINK